MLYFFCGEIFRKLYYCNKIVEDYADHGKMICCLQWMLLGHILHRMWQKIKQNLCVFIVICYFVNRFLYIMITFLFYLLYHDHIYVLCITSWYVLLITSWSHICFIYHFSQQVIWSTCNYNLIKIKCLFYLFFCGDTLISNNILYRVTSGYIFSIDQPMMSLLHIGIKTK